MQREKNRCWSYTILFITTDMIYPIVKCVQIDTPHRDARYRKFDQSSEEPFAWGLQVHDDDAVRLHDGNGLYGEGVIEFKTIGGSELHSPD